MQLNGKVALVTGAASGIGLAIARRYATEGAKVVLSDLPTSEGERVTAALRQEGFDCSFVNADVSQPRDCQRLVEQTVARYGRLDIACNNAGIGGELAPLADYGLDAWAQVIGVNLTGVFQCMKYEIPELLKTGGAIVNIASILGQVGFATASAYTAAKHGVLGLTKVAALEYAAQGLRINAVGPAFIHTPMIARLDADEAGRKALEALHPIGRIGQPEEVAELVLWLSSPGASFMNGAYVPVDGGYLAR
jgi:NAD(P)-dependent dehydrogenase (short-subunit alcohol dehydrogenase family)